MTSPVRTIVDAAEAGTGPEHIIEAVGQALAQVGQHQVGSTPVEYWPEDVECKAAGRAWEACRDALILEERTYSGRLPWAAERFASPGSASRGARPLRLGCREAGQDTMLPVSWSPGCEAR